MAGWTNSYKLLLEEVIQRRDVAGEARVRERGDTI